MFEHKVPLFSPGPLKKEILLSLRDIALSEQKIRYYDYSDGIISGCGLFEENMHIGVLGGMIKFGGRLYFLPEKISVPYEPTEQWTVLKVRFHAQAPSREFTYYTSVLALDSNTQIAHNELEMGRFKLKQGSRLRTEYKDFWDMRTEYDTVDLLHTCQSAPNESTINPVITMHFARQAYAHLNGNAADAAFCTQCLTSPNGVSRELILRYISLRTAKAYQQMSNAQIHEQLAVILNEITGRGMSDHCSQRTEGVLLFD